MADKVQGAISFTPIVAITADDDASATTAIHHDIKGALGGNMTYDFGGDDKWFYAPHLIVTNASTAMMAPADDLTDLTGASGSHTDSSEAPGGGVKCHFTDNASTEVDASADDIRFLFIRNTGTSDTSNTTTTNSVYLTINAVAATHNGQDAIEIAAGEAWMGKVNNVVEDFLIISGQANAAGTAATVNGSPNVRCVVAAVIDDGGH